MDNLPHWNLEVPDEILIAVARKFACDVIAGNIQTKDVPECVRVYVKTVLSELLEGLKNGHKKKPVSNWSQVFPVRGNSD